MGQNYSLLWSCNYFTTSLYQTTITFSQCIVNNLQRHVIWVICYERNRTSLNKYKLNVHSYNRQNKEETKTTHMQNNYCSNKRIRRVSFLRNCVAASVGVLQDKLVLSTRLIIWVGHYKEIQKLTFRALALRRSQGWRLMVAN